MLDKSFYGNGPFVRWQKKGKNERKTLYYDNNMCVFCQSTVLKSLVGVVGVIQICCLNCHIREMGQFYHISCVHELYVYK